MLRICLAKTGDPYAQRYFSITTQNLLQQVSDLSRRISRSTLWAFGGLWQSAEWK
jgi:hypothetical protein